MSIGNATALALIVVAAESGSGAIPQPDGVVFGTVYVDGAVVDQSEDCVVLARVDGFDEPVAVYRMGDLPAAGNAYALHIPHRLQLDGTTPAPDTPLADAVARIYVIEDRGPEVLAGQLPVPASGKAILLDLDVSASDPAAGRDLGSSRSGGCGNGGLCGTMGMISLAWITVGLCWMRMSVRSQRRSR